MKENSLFFFFCELIRYRSRAFAFVSIYTTDYFCGCWCESTYKGKGEMLQRVHIWNSDARIVSLNQEKCYPGEFQCSREGVTIYKNTLFSYRVSVRNSFSLLHFSKYKTSRYCQTNHFCSVRQFPFSQTFQNKNFFLYTFFKHFFPFFWSLSEFFKYNTHLV